MKSLRSLFRIGLGPSSSHTMGPNRAAIKFAERCSNVDSYRVTLYGSLAATGRGHMTDVAIINVLEPIFVVAVLLLVTAYFVDGSFSAFLYFRF